MNTSQALIVAAAFVPLGALGVVAIHFGLGARDATRYRERLAALEARRVVLTEAEQAAAKVRAAEPVRPEVARLRAALDQGEAALTAALDELTSEPIERARAQAERGEHERAARSIVQGLRLAQLGDDGTLSGTLLESRVRRYVMDQAALVVEAGLVEPRVLLEILGPELRADFDAAEVERVLRAELAGLRALEPADPGLADGARGLLEYPRRAERMLAGLEAHERCLGLVSLPAEEFEAERRAILGSLAGEDPLHVEQAVSFVVTARQQHAYERLFHVALAAYAFHAADGEWPASLDLLGPFLDGDVPRDPWTGAPFAYGSYEEGRLLGTGTPEELARRRRFPTAGAGADPKGTPAFLLQ